MAVSPLPAVESRRLLQRASCSLLLMACGALVHGAAYAQVQRSFVNLGFEDPLSTFGTQCIAQWDESAIPGWTTNHPSMASGFNSCTPRQGPNPGRLIELWHLGGVGFAGGPVTSRTGTTHAELNAEAASRLYQNVCVVSGETVSWRLSHRSRNAFGTGGPTAYDVMRFLVDTNIVATLSSSAVSTFAPPVLGVFGGTASGTAGPNGWTDYTGSFVYSGPTGIRQFGFEAVSAQSGVTQGNFLDEIQITLLPYVEFGSPAAFTTLEGTGISVPSLKVSGTVPAGGITVPVSVSGTAVSGADYTPFTLTYTVPAGVYYDASIPPSVATLSSVQDVAIENNETILMTLSPGAGYIITSTTTCGTAPANNTITWTLLDNDVDLRTTKSTSTAAPILGTPFTYTVTYQNNTATTTLAPTTSHDVTAAINDAVPAGLTFTSWTCQASNGASCPGGAVNGSTSGSGPITGNAVLPAGTAAAGGLLRYTITASLATSACTSITNTSTIATPSGFQEGTSVQAGFTSPVSGGTTNNTASVAVTPVCTVDLVVTKSASPASLVTGDVVTYTIVASNNGPSTASNVVLSDAPSTGQTCTTPSSTATCTATGGASCPGPTVPVTGLLGAGIIIPTLPVGGQVTVTMQCTINASGQ